MQQPIAQHQTTELALLATSQGAGNITGQASIRGNEKSLHDVDACCDGAELGIGLQSGSVCFRRPGCVWAVSVARGGRTQRLRPAAQAFKLMRYSIRVPERAVRDRAQTIVQSYRLAGK